MLPLKEINTIHEIARRAVKLYQRLDIIRDDKTAQFALTGIADEIMTVHREIVPLRLEEMLLAGDWDFAHDIGGIHRHLKYGYGGTSQLTDCFLPRFARMIP